MATNSTLRRIGFVIGVTCVALSLAVSVGAKELNVPAEFKTIAEALSNASAGDVIKVAEGTYMENLEIFVGVTLEGAGAEKTIIDGMNGRDQQKPVILVRGVDNVTIRGFTLQNGRRGIHAEKVNALLIEKNVVQNNLRQGIITYFSEGKILNNQVSNNLVDVDNQNGRGIFIEASKFEIRDNQLTNNALDGIVVRDSTDGRGTPSEVILTENKITGNRGYGLYVFGAVKIAANKNEITDNNSYGVMLRGNQDTFGTVEGALTGNTITGNTGLGIYLYSLAKVEVSKNLVANTKSMPDPNQGAGDGIFVARGSEAKIVENTITGNARSGIVVSSQSVAQLDSNVIQANQGCGVAGGSQATITGSNNEISDNAGGDLCGSAPTSLKK
jgi:parallel beta-helix repeat protein